ncbi:MAG: prolipoprotein diacylglyceryl transferase [Clostridiaceae bacterium]|nr:prolipoprotein diacylglyceryl transferase [Clostridiaceae bacterium]
MRFVLNYHVSFPGLGIENLVVNREAFVFNLFGRELTVFWYGLIFTLAMILCIVIAMMRAKNFGFTRDDILDYFLWMIPLILVGSRLYYVVFEWDQFKGSFASIFDLRQGGLAFYGGVLGGMLAVAIAARIKRVKLHRILDYLAVLIPLGQGIGRWGNFFNQEAFGTNTSMPWGMISEGTRQGLAALNPDPANPLPGLNPNLPVHPTFFYEFAANMIIFAVLLLVHKRQKRPWTTVLTYFFLYGIVRFFVEGIRTDSLMFNAFGSTFRISQVLSAVMVVGAVIVFVIIRGRAKKRHQLIAELATAPEQVPEFSPADDTDQE